MNFTEAVAEAVSTHKRLDKLATTKKEINAAIAFFCSDSDFKRDIDEILLPINAEEYSQLIPFSSFTRFRKLQFIKRGGRREYLTPLPQENLKNAKCYLDKWYIAGTGIRINMGKLATSLDIGYYQYPPILTDVDPNFWLLEAQPYMIIDRAISKIFSDIGDNTSSKDYMNNSNMSYLAFRASLNR